jgi:hypothetical protein
VTFFKYERTEKSKPIVCQLCYSYLSQYLYITFSLGV